MAVQLSKGVVREICKDEIPSKMPPIVKVMLMYHGYDHRLIIRDEDYRCECALVPELNHLVVSGKISQNCIISLDEYIKNYTDDETYVITIIDLTVLVSGDGTTDMGALSSHSLLEGALQPIDTLDAVRKICGLPAQVQNQIDPEDCGRWQNQWIKSFKKRGVYVKKAKFVADEHIWSHKDEWYPGFVL